MDELDIDYQGDSIEIGFNVTYLIDALSNMSQDMVQLDLSDGNSSALFTIPGKSQLLVRRDAHAHLKASSSIVSQTPHHGVSSFRKDQHVRRETQQPRHRHQPIRCHRCLWLGLHPDS